MRPILPVWLALAAAPLALAGVNAAAQSVMTDYESSAKAAQAQLSAQWRLAFRPPLLVLQQTVNQLRSLPRVTDSQRSAADELLKQAAGQTEPDARRTLWRAASLLLGSPWTTGQDEVGSLALRTATPILSGSGDRVRFERLYPVQAGKVRFVLDLFRSEPTTSATPVRGPRLKSLRSGAIGPGSPGDVTVDLRGVADGAYLLIAKVSAADGAAAELVQPVYVVRDVASKHAALKASLAVIAGHDDARWTAEYPYALAEALRGGTREVISYDFPRAMARSQVILADLRAGRDPVRQARGLQDRAYRFAATGELVPYQIYVPSSWTPERKWPLVVALHGANLDETNMLGRAGGAMQKLAERYGFIVVSPLGYRLNSAYGSERGMSRAIVGDQAERRRRSEDDVLLVTALVEKEYNVDPARRYLTGNSMGGGGTWWIGGRHPDQWAALAPAAYGGVLPEDVPALARTPILAVVGDHDEIGMLDRVRASVATLRAGGVNPEVIEVPGGTHASAFETALPAIFEFFEKHVK